MSTTNQPLMTSLAEIYSFKPCPEGWKDILRGQGKTCANDVLFPLVDCCKSNSVSDVLWLIGRRKIESQIAIKFARMCADSVAHLKNADAVNAANAAADANAYIAYATTAAIDADTDAISAAVNAASDNGYVSVSVYANAHNKQKELNKAFLIQCINSFEE